MELNNPKQEFFTILDLNRFANRNFSQKQNNDIKSSLMPFWNHYIGIESTVSAHNMLNEVNNCLYDLNVFLAINKINLEKILLLTPQRTKKYSVIDNMLKSEGVKDADRKVTLDGHDFACNSPDPIDFVTFDEECYTGAKNVKILCFNNIKGKYDF